MKKIDHISNLLVSKWLKILNQNDHQRDDHTYLSYFAGNYVILALVYRDPSYILEKKKVLNAMNTWMMECSYMSHIERFDGCTINIHGHHFDDLD